MKRVHYLAGALGLAPLAAGLGAHGMAPQPPAPGKAKIVSMHPLQERANTDTGCDGSKYKHMSQYSDSPNFTGYFWWGFKSTGGFCVGTVDAVETAGVPTTQEIKVTVYVKRCMDRCSFSYPYDFKDELLIPNTPTAVGVHHGFASANYAAVCISITNFRGRACGVFFS